MDKISETKQTHVLGTKNICFSLRFYILKMFKNIKLINIISNFLDNAMKSAF